MQVFATSPAAVYTGVGNAFTRISSTEGMRALWRGVSSVIMGAGPAHAVHFGTYEMVKEFAGGNVDGAQNQWIATCTWSLGRVYYSRDANRPNSENTPHPILLSILSIL